MKPSLESSPKSSRPILKWAGGKTQLLDTLLPLIPSTYGKYIEPFFGGGALFFAEKPATAVIADSNPELINLYRVVATNVADLISELKKFSNDKKVFLEERKLDWMKLSPARAAARTIFLNRTCFNGLYRINKSGGFNVPFGNYKNPKICDEHNLFAAAELLANKTIIGGDYKEVLRKYASPGDFVFLDPPYLPISKYSDFKRYTKELFYEEDHVELAAEVARLYELGCTVVLTNSNHPLVHTMYGKYSLTVHQTKRNINSKAKGRKGEDVVVLAKPIKRLKIVRSTQPLSAQAKLYPQTRFMGSKRKLLSHIRDVVNHFPAETVLDLFSGSGVVSYMLKAEGKQVLSNDYMAMSSTFTKALVENSSRTLSNDTIEHIINNPITTDNFVQTTYKDLYYSDSDNLFIDNVRGNIAKIKNPYDKAIAMAALIRACTKKRPRGIFTYVGHRYDDGRKDLKMSFEQQFRDAVKAYNRAVFDNGKKNKAQRNDAMKSKLKADLVYIDPPYYSQHSDNEYVRRYHFVEGLACNWQGVDMQLETKTKKFKNYPTPFSTKIGSHDAFDKLFQKYAESVLIVSYSSNSLPSLEDMINLMSKYKKHVEVEQIDYQYSFGNQGHKVNKNNNSAQEYLFIGF